jgi:23S rRNA (adenine2503-C2)-methyltransferase
VSGPARTGFVELDAAGLEAWCGARGMPRFAARQLADWVYAKGTVDLGVMTNLSKSHRDLLAHELAFLQGDELKSLEATDGTRKLLLGWPAPGVMLPVLGVATGRETECVEGNLTAGRIVEQVWRLARVPGVGRITNVVFMGMGEPLANFAAVTDAIRTLNAPWGMGIGARRITVSTVGLPAAIRKLCGFEIPVTLALSLHAPNDELRRKIIPWAEYSTVAELLDACQEWFRKTGREITLEYILLGGFNDRREHAEELARVARTIRANVNLIRYNEVDGLPFARPDDRDVLEFQGILREAGVNTHIRASRGRDIKAACGQLRHESMRA